MSSNGRELVGARSRPTGAIVGLTREGKLNFEFAIILMRNWNRDSARNMRMVEQITILRPAREVPCGTIRAHGRAK
jgi:hypothetical protein